MVEQLKEQEEAKHDAWNPPLVSEQKNEVEKKQSFGWLPLNDASLASYLQKQKEKGKTLSPADEKLLEGCKHVRKQERQASLFASSGEFYRMCKKGFPAHDEKNEVEKKQSFGWLPEKKASLASYLQKQKEQSQLLSQAHELFLKGLKHYNVGCVNFLK